MAKTVEQIASDLNLSVTTVRLVLNGKAEQYRISVKTQTRINEYVERYGYIINHSARSLKLNKTDTLGLIVPNISNVFFATLAEKLEQRCRRSGYQLTISCTYDDVDYENKLTKAFIARNVDGLLLFLRRWKISSIIYAKFVNQWFYSTVILNIPIMHW